MNAIHLDGANASDVASLIALAGANSERWRKIMTQLPSIACCAVLLSLAGASPAAEDAYPSRRITIIIPFGTGGATDLLARLLAQKMSVSMNQTIVVENHPGAGGSIGSLEVARAPANGYTLLLGTSSTHGINPWIYKLPYDVTKDFAPITMVATTEYALSVNPKFNPGVASIRDLINLAKTRRTTYASTGNGTTSHLGAALFAKISKTDFVHIPYKSQAPAQIDLLGGQVDFMIDNVSTVLPQAKAEKLRILATAGRARTAVTPDIPTLIEAGVPDYEIVGWFVLFAPAGTPEPIVNTLNAEAVKALNLPDVRERMLADGNTPFPATPAETKVYLASQLARFKKVVDAAGARLD